MEGYRVSCSQRPCIQSQQAGINTRGGEAKMEKENTRLSERVHICPQAVELCGRRDGSRGEDRELRPLVLGQRLGERTKLPTINQTAIVSVGEEGIGDIDRPVSRDVYRVS